MLTLLSFGFNCPCCCATTNILQRRNLAIHVACANSESGILAPNTLTITHATHSLTHNPTQSIVWFGRLKKKAMMEALKEEERVARIEAKKARQQKKKQQQEEQEEEAEEEVQSGAADESEDNDFDQLEEEELDTSAMAKDFFGALHNSECACFVCVFCLCVVTHLTIWL